MHPSADEVRVQLDRLLSSGAFANTARLSRFLRFVVERTLAGEEADRLKEYVIGVEVFDRDERYDPRMDSIVRVEAQRLRTKIDEYYAGAGASDPVIIRIRRGSYAPTFERRQAPASPVPVATEAGGAARPVRGWRLVAGIAIGVLLLGAIAAWRAGLWAGHEGTSAGRPAGVTIAVLPFFHHAVGDADRLLAARMTDGVTSELARIGTLSVVSYTSARQFEGARRPMREIAETLRADLILEGTASSDGDRVRIDARLVDTTRDRKFWSQDFVGSSANLPDLERRIAQAAAAAAQKRQPR